MGFIKAAVLTINSGHHLLLYLLRQDRVRGGTFLCGRQQNIKFAKLSFCSPDITDPLAPTGSILEF